MPYSQVGSIMVILGSNPFFGGHLGRHFEFVASYHGNEGSNGVGNVVNGFYDPENPLLDMLYSQVGSIMVILRSSPHFGSHLGRHLDFLKTLNDAGWASFSFVM